MRRWWPAALLLVLITPSAVAPPLPANAIENGGFESGLAGWTIVRGHPEIVPGLSGSGLAITDECNGEYVRQSLAPGRGVGVLSFAARIDANPDPSGATLVEAISDHQPISGAAAFEVWVYFSGARIEFAVWSLDPHDEGTSLPMPLDGLWHDYTVLLAGAVGFLLVDDVVAAFDVGNPLTVGPADRLIIGDVASCARGTVAPSMTFDDVYLDPV